MAQEMHADAHSRIASWAHVLAVRDIDVSAKYFCQVLGFALDWSDATDWRLVRRDDVRVMLGKCPNAIPASDTGPHSWFAYVEVDDVDKLHAEFVANEAIILQPPLDRHYGMRELTIATPDGHRIVFGEDLAKRKPLALPR
jgi:predicted enzyme related to lactoylglutathione lyase